MKKLLICVSLLFFCAFDQKGYIHHLEIKNHQTNQSHKFIVNIVNSDKDMARGLMFVDDLPQNYGMLFEFKNEKIVSMWMKNTKIPLDMIFIDKNNQIIHIVENTAPESLEIISSEKPALKVLEINAGKVKDLGIKVEDKILLNGLK